MQDLKIKLRKILRRHWINNYIPAAATYSLQWTFYKLIKSIVSPGIVWPETWLIDKVCLCAICLVDSLHCCLSSQSWEQKKIKSLLRPFCITIKYFCLFPLTEWIVCGAKDQADKFLSFNISVFKLFKSTKRSFCFPERQNWLK